ncbi:MAG: DNA replication/repair protein RecF [Acidimicrobiales bacterium]|nr:DNA replication/repair protein RecF [Acidimicrobiales bacterium]
MDVVDPGSALILEQLSLQGFRSHDDFSMAFAPGVTAIVGPNGSGKTNIVEAVAWLATTRSFRGAPTDALIKRGSEVAIVRGQLRGENNRELLLEAELSRTGRTRIQMNKQKVQRARDLAGVMAVTVFAPDDLELVKGSPGERRTYLDHVLLGLHPRNDGLRADMEKILKQRNALLKGCGGRLDRDAAFTLDVWDDKLATVGDQLGALRAEAVASLSPRVSEALSSVAGPGNEVTLRYDAPWFETGLKAALTESRTNDVRRGVTTVGPHRDEIEIMLNAMPARTHASQGEQRSVALALRLAGHHLVEATTGVAPLLVLDDVFSELDDSRSAALVAALPHGQTLLTSATDLPPGAIADATINLESTESAVA